MEMSDIHSSTFNAQSPQCSAAIMVKCYDDFLSFLTSNAHAVNVYSSSAISEGSRLPWVWAWQPLVNANDDGVGSKQSTAWFVS
jgi:hypothetical protein